MSCRLGYFVSLPFLLESAAIPTAITFQQFHFSAQAAQLMRQPQTQPMAGRDNSLGDHWHLVSRKGRTGTTPPNA